MSSPDPTPKNPLKEIIQPFIDLVRAPRALWGINLAYVIEGMVYFGMLGYLAMYFNDYIGLNDIWAGRMVGVLTAGITIMMFFLGSIADWKGVRFALIAAFALMLCGRTLISAAPIVDPSHVNITTAEAAPNDPVFLLTDAEPMPVAEPEPAVDGATEVQAEVTETEIAPSPISAVGQPAVPEGEEAPADAPEAAPSPGFGSTAHWLALFGILIIITGYGMYQPAAYAGVRQFTTPATAAMGFAMLYALMNLGGWLPSFFGFVRQGVGIDGAMWIYTAFTVFALFATLVILSRRTVDEATAEARAAREAAKRAGAGPAAAGSEPAVSPVAGEKKSFLSKFVTYITSHPLTDLKFTYFIFCLIPVQTLFAHNWLTLPMYVERSFRGSVIGDYFEFAVNLNPLLIFIFVPIVTALTQKAKVYNMMIYGTFIMAAPTFLLALGATPWTLGAYLLIMTIGEAMWQPRFLQYAAEIAPEGRTGQYMGVAQLPWFLTKMIVPLYSGWFLQEYVPERGEVNSEMMWLIYASIAMASTILLVLAKPWIGKDFKTKAD